MAQYKNEKIVGFPLQEVFRIYKKTAKRDFPKFNEKEAVGTSVSRQVGAYGNKKTTMLVTITGYEPNKLYEVTSTHRDITYKSRYEFNSIDENTTKITLIEETHGSGGVFEVINNVLAIIIYRWKVKKRFKALILGLEKEIQDVRNRVEKSKPKEIEKDN